MTKATTIKISIPYIVREICSEISEILNQNFGLPMNVKIGKEKANIHFPRNGFKVIFESGFGHFGQWIAIKSITASMRFDWIEDAEKWVEKLERFSGKLDWNFNQNEGKLRFSVEGIALNRLAMNGSNRNNGHRAYEWDDPKNPYNEKSSSSL